ncbi:ABC transporter permease [Microbacterium ulmi]|uniref:ABC transporter permease n=1 Tax=Microbacterium ulmi TaxID=179095 RepID=A0A7Y2M0G0_9MICO|nr:ABC transporter permease [Microbacterium ulmi]NII68934.1 putative ABC transport system permease protein [Microbacterium ulmi]NNH03917.1 ABC transporter permease [Microbacterium ulmi]
MNAGDLVTSAVSNTFRSKTRTILTILAIFVGAFTLTITNGLGTGINRFIADTVSSIGAEDVMTVTKTPDAATGGLPSNDPVEYDPDAIGSGRPGPGGFGGTVTAMTTADLDTLEGIDGVLRVEAAKSVSPDFIQHDGGTRWVIGVGNLIPGQTAQLAAGTTPDLDADQLQIAIPVSFVEPLGFDSADDAIGQTVTIAISDAVRTQHTVEATIVGVAEETFVGGGASALPNDALTDALFSLQNTGVPLDQQDRFASASVWFDPDATADQVDDLASALADAGFTGTTVADQLGAFTSIIDAIVLVLNAFAIIALLAASFGIVNTLLMSVQERTREIGLMKAMGMGSGRVFTLFSLEAVFIGFLGSAIGAGIAMLVGGVVSRALANGLFADLPGLTLIAFDPVSIAVIILVVMGIAFLAGTLPAARAAKADPVESLRYE